MQQPVLLDIFSDPICPWCYIGLHRLDQAIAEMKQPIETRWRCFMLNPGMPEGGTNRRLYLEKKFGGREGVDRLYKAIETTARNAGLEIDFTRIEKVPSTIKAHQALRQAQANNKADCYARALFDAYFKRGLDIGTEQVLLDLWIESGLAPSDLNDCFHDNRYFDDIHIEQEQARHHGVSGVPFFVIGGKYALSGAHDQSMLHQVFELLNQEHTP